MSKIVSLCNPSIHKWFVLPTYSVAILRELGNFPHKITWITENLGLKLLKRICQNWQRRTKTHRVDYLVHVSAWPPKNDIPRFEGYSSISNTPSYKSLKVGDITQNTATISPSDGFHTSPKLPVWESSHPIFVHFGGPPECLPKVPTTSMKQPLSYKEISAPLHVFQAAFALALQGFSERCCWCILAAFPLVRYLQNSKSIK